MGKDTLFDINDFDDKNVWDFICSGRTKGVFQLESNLGRHWSKQLRPQNISELAALISVIRPGTLTAKVDGKSMTQHYCDRKAGKDPVSYQHESLEPILKETQGIICYQEQAMKITEVVAGFDLKEADMLRKAIGKKKADLMEEVKKNFIKGAEKQDVVSCEVAEEIFSWIEKSNRYSFNKSHAVSYAINAYWSAYCKYYRPLEFYISYLNHAHGKPEPQKEIKELVVDAKLSDIDVYPPRIGNLYKDFTNINGKIFFGLSHVKNIGATECDKITSNTINNEIKDYTWIQCLIEIIHNLKINKRAVVSMISIGAMNGKNNTVPRKTMLYEFDSWNQLTSREKEYISQNFLKEDTLYDAINRMLENFKLTPKRKSVIADINISLKNPFYNIEDSIQTIAQDEEKYMGCSLTCSKADASEESFGATLCKDISNGLITGKTNIVVSINSVREYKTKKGKNPGQTMAFLCVEDNSGILDSVTVFPEAYSEYKDLIIEQNTVLIHGETSKKDKTSLIVNKVKQI